MTVDMLTATFFWPEGERLGAGPDDAEPAERAAETREADRGSVADGGFWSAVMRRLRRPTRPVPEVEPS